MCTVCGCSGGKATLEDEEPLPHTHAEHTHPAHSLEGADLTPAPSRAHTPGLSQKRMVQIERDILSKNDRYARENRRYFQTHGI